MPTSTGRLFVTLEAERGPTTASRITSMADFAALYGDRLAANTVGYDYLDAAFSTGLAEAYVARVQGPGASVGLLTRMDRAGTPLATLRFDSKYAGAYSSRITVQIVAGTNATTQFTVVVFFDGVEVERYTDLTSPAAAATAIAASAYVVAVNLNSATVAPNNNPSVQAATALSAGSDDRGNITDTHWTAGLVSFGKGLGPGQVAAAGRTTATARAALIAHAKLMNRTALLDAPDLTSAASLVALRVTDALVSGAEYAATFAPWITIPGLTSGTTRTVPGSAVAAGLINASDAAQSTGQAAAGDPHGNAPYVLGVTTVFTDDERVTLNAGNVNIFRIGPTGVQLYGFRSISSDPNWLQLTFVRLRMELQDQLNRAAERFTFKTITQATFGDFAAALLGVFAEHYAEGVLFGATPELAYNAVTDESVNTTQVLATGELRGKCWYKQSPFAEHVQIDVTKSLI